MDKELEIYYENQLELFHLPGWKELIEKVKEIREGVADIRNIKTSEDFHFNKGQVDILDFLINWEDMVKMAVEQNE